ncbi:MAG: hypothetical protein AAF591_18740, partial [Verrucomicrobiota bacterium]
DSTAMVTRPNQNYKMIIFGDPEDLFEDPIVEFYNIGAPANDYNEQSPLYSGPHPLDSAYTGNGLTGDAAYAFDACIAKDAALGGGFSTPAIPNPNEETLYFELPIQNGTGVAVPNLNNVNNGNPLPPIAITVGGVDAEWDTGLIPGTPNDTPAARVNSSDLPDRYWVKFTFDPVAAGFSTPGNEGPHTVTVQIQGGQGLRIFDALTTYTYTP